MGTWAHGHISANSLITAYREPVSGGTHKRRYAQAAVRTSGGTHKLTFRADALEEHDQLELEENDGVYGVYRRTSARRIEWSNEFAYKGEVEGLVEVPVEMIGGDKFLQ